MQFFSKSFLDWLDEDGFWVKDSWDYDSKRWVGPGKLILMPFQRRILGHVLTLRDDGSFPYSTVLYSTVKKCMDSDEHLWLTDGTWARSGDLIGKEFNVWSYDGEKLVTANATAQWNGFESCYRIHTELGRVVYRTAEHPLFTWGGWKRVQDLQVGESIAAPAVVPEPVDAKEEDPMLMRFLGYMIAEGSLGGNGYIGFSQKPGPVLDEMFEIARHFGFEMYQTKSHPNDYRLTKPGRQLCQKYGITGKLSHQHRVPDVVFHATNDGVTEFLSAFFDGDGWAAVSVNGSTRRVEVGYGTISEGLARDFATLFARFGLHPHIHQKPMPTGRNVKVSWHVLFTSSDEVKIVATLLRSRGKQKALDAVVALANEREIHRASKSETLPVDAWDDVFIAKRLSGKSFFSSRSKSSPVKETWAATREKITYYAQYFGDSVLEEKANQPLIWDKIVSIEYAGERPTVAITVPGYENYITDILDHNSGKTTLGAMVGAWFAECCPAGSELFCIANDEQQTVDRMMKDVKYHAARVKELEEDLREVKIRRINNGEIIYANDTFIQALSQSYRSSAGSRHALTLWDELWGVSTEGSRRMWDEMTPIPTIPYSLRFVATYAGFINESDLLWDLYINGVGEAEHPEGRGEVVPELADITDSAGNPLCFKNKGQFTFWAHEPMLPYQDEKYYAEQLATLRPAAYLRLHENQWVTTHETFIPIEWWDYAAKSFSAPAEFVEDHPYRNLPVYVGVDAAIKRDCTAVIGVAYDVQRGKVALLFHRIWTPQEDDPIDLEATVENYILAQRRKFNITEVAYDPRDLQQTMVRLRKAGIKCEEITQNNSTMTAASQTLYDLLKWKNLLCYPDDELKAHVQNAVAQQEAKGFRIVRQGKSKNAVGPRKPIDGVVALAMACYRALNSGGVEIRPIRVQAPFSDMTGWSNKRGQVELPWPFME